MGFRLNPLYIDLRWNTRHYGVPCYWELATKWFAIHKWGIELKNGLMWVWWWKRNSTSFGYKWLDIETDMPFDTKKEWEEWWKVYLREEKLRNERF